MISLPEPVYQQCRKALLQCQEFSNHVALKTVFITEDLKPFQGKIRFAENQNLLVDYCIEDLLKSYHRDGRNILEIFLLTLRNKYPPEDKLHHDLTNIYQFISTSRSNKQRANASEGQGALEIVGTPQFGDLIVDKVSADKIVTDIINNISHVTNEFTLKIQQHTKSLNDVKIEKGTDVFPLEVFVDLSFTLLTYSNTVNHHLSQLNLGINYIITNTVDLLTHAEQHNKQIQYVQMARQYERLIIALNSAIDGHLKMYDSFISHVMPKVYGHRAKVHFIDTLKQYIAILRASKEFYEEVKKYAVEKAENSDV